MLDVVSIKLAALFGVDEDRSFKNISSFLLSKWLPALLVVVGVTLAFDPPFQLALVQLLKLDRVVLTELHRELNELAIESAVMLHIGSEEVEEEAAADDVVLEFRFLFVVVFVVVVELSSSLIFVLIANSSNLSNMSERVLLSVCSSLMVSFCTSR